MVQRSSTLDRTFSALSDATRRDVLDRLVRGPASISELAEPLGMSLTGMKKHVRILEDAKLVTTQKLGRTRVCHLGPAKLTDATRWIERYRRRWEARLDRLQAVVETRKGIRHDI